MVMTKEQGAKWATNRIGGLLTAGQPYGAQCMTFVIEFCWEFGWHPTGNAKDLAIQSLPSGWRRIPYGYEVFIVFT